MTADRMGSRTPSSRTAGRAAVRPATRAAALLMLAFACGGCVSAEEQRRAHLSEDTGTCADFGARYGSPAHTRCMLAQQERRDHEQLLNLERARISSETARNNLEMLEAMRERRRRN